MPGESEASTISERGIKRDASEKEEDVQAVAAKTARKQKTRSQKQSEAIAEFVALKKRYFVVDDAVRFAACKRAEVHEQLEALLRKYREENYDIWALREAVLEAKFQCGAPLQCGALLQSMSMRALSIATEHAL